MWPLIDPFPLLLASLPLIGYLAMFALIRLSGRAVVTTGGRDFAALAVAISGLVAIGPIELFFPSTAATRFGPWVWVALAFFYFLVVTLLNLIQAPALVVYGRTHQEIFPKLLAACRSLDAAAAGDEEALEVYLPESKIRVRVDGARGIDSARIRTFAPVRNEAFWNRLLTALRTEMSGSVRPAYGRAAVLVAMASLLAAIVLTSGFSNQQLLVDGFRDWLWR